MGSAILLAILVGCGSSAPVVSPVPSPATLNASASSGSIPELAYFVGRWRAEAHHPSSGKRFELD